MLQELRIVLPSFLAIRQHFSRVVDVGERFILLVAPACLVGMFSEGELSVSKINIALRGVTSHIQNVVIIRELSVDEDDPQPG